MSNRAAAGEFDAREGRLRLSPPCAAVTSACVSLGDEGGKR
jgi:hypothetical protein